MELLEQLQYGRNVEEIERLLKLGIDVNYQESVTSELKNFHNYRNRHALHILANCDYCYTSDQKLEILNLLIKYGANIDAQDSVGRTPLMAFLWKKNQPDEDCIKCLLNNNADVNLVTYTNHETALNPVNISYMVKEEGIFKMLLERIDDINSRNLNGETPLMHFVRIGANIGCIRAMIEAGADIKCLDSNSNNILKFFSSDLKFSKDRLTVFKALIDYGADVNVMNWQGVTPLMHLISNHCDPSFVHILLQKGANIFDTDHSGEGVLFHYSKKLYIFDIKEKQYHPLLELLLDCGIKINLLHKHFNPKLLYVMGAGQWYNFVEILLMNGAYINSENENEIYYLSQFYCKYIYKYTFSHITAELFQPLHVLLYKYTSLWSHGETFLMDVDVIKAIKENRIDKYPNSLQLQHELFGFIPSFKLELNKLKTEYIKKDLTLFTFCMENDRQKLGRHFSGCSVDFTKLKKEFPNYFNFIDYKLGVAERWHNTMDKIEKLPFWCSTTSDGKEVHLPLDCLKHIMNFLTNYELINLSSAME